MDVPKSAPLAYVLNDTEVRDITSGPFGRTSDFDPAAAANVTGS
jgi:hypothetical protein